MELVMEISMTPTGNKGGHGDVPLESVIIEKIEQLD